MISAFSICMPLRLNTRRSRNFLWVTAQKMKFSIKDFLSKCDTFTEEILHGKLHFLCCEFDGIKISLHYIKSRNFRLISWCGSFVETYIENCTIPQSFYTIKLGEITVSYTVLTVYKLNLGNVSLQIILTMSLNTLIILFKFKVNSF